MKTKTETGRFEAVIGKLNEPALEQGAFYLLDYNKINSVDDILKKFNSIRKILGFILN